MSLGSDFIGGFNATSEARARKKKLEQDERLTQAEAQLRRDLQKNQIDSDVQRMREGFTNNSLEADKDRSWRRDERLGGETFQDGQSTKSQTYDAKRLKSTQDFQAGESMKDRMDRAIESQARLLSDARRMNNEERRTDIMGKEATTRAAAGPAAYRNQPSYEQEYDPDGTPGMMKVKSYGAPPPMLQRPATQPTMPSAPAPANQPPSPSFTQNLFSAGTTMRAGMAGMAPRENAQSLPGAAAPAQDPSLEGRIVKDPSGKRYKMVNGQPVPLQ
jgi:hypothetical protein